MTGQQLGRLIQEKWGYSFDVQLRKVKGALYLQVMWKYLEQASFPLSESEYWAHLESIAAYLNAWGCIDQVTAFLQATRERPRLGKAVSIPLDLGDRASEWLLEH